MSIANNRITFRNIQCQTQFQSLERVTQQFHEGDLQSGQNQRYQKNQSNHLIIINHNTQCSIYFFEGPELESRPNSIFTYQKLRENRQNTLLIIFNQQKQIFNLNYYYKRSMGLIGFRNIFEFAKAGQCLIIFGIAINSELRMLFILTWTGVWVN